MSTGFFNGERKKDCGALSLLHGERLLFCGVSPWREGDKNGSEGILKRKIRGDWRGLAGIGPAAHLSLFIAFPQLLGGHLSLP
jgi:hypothetical protein